MQQSMAADAVAASLLRLAFLRIPSPHRHIRFLNNGRSIVKVAAASQERNGAR